jgi:cytochrome P450
MATIGLILACGYKLQVLKETLRMYPVIPVVPRTPDKDLKIHGFNIPAGTVIIAGIRAMHLSGVGG